MTEEKTVIPAAADHADSPNALANVLEESLRRDKARKFRKGDRVHGRVYKLGESMAFVDLGGRAEGMLDLTDLRKADGSLDLEEGTEIEGIVIDVAANGVLLRRALISQEESVEQIIAAHHAGIPVPAKVTAVNKGGVELDLFGLRAFCPASQWDVRKIDDFSGFVGETHQFRIAEISPDGKKIVLSRRALLADEHDKVLAEVRARITVGAILKGTVARVQPFGAFIDLGGIEGLAHVTEITRHRLHDANEALKAGQDVEVQVLKIEDVADKTGKKVERIALSLKALEKDPWDGAVERYPVGSKVKGRIARLQPFGAFIEIAPGIDGLAHVSTLADKRIEHPREAVKEGDEVEAFVLAVEPDKKRLSLSLKEPRKPEPRREPPERPARRASPGEGHPAPGADRAPRPGSARPASTRLGDRPLRQPREERAPRPSAPAGGEAKPSYPLGSVHEGVVDKVETFGVFVTLPGGGRALVPHAELGVTKNADQKIDLRKFFPVGAKVRLAITEHRRGELKGSKIEAERADERAMVKDWSSGQKRTDTGKTGFGTLGDLFKKANVVK